MTPRVAFLFLLPLAGFGLGWWMRGSGVSTSEPDPVRDAEVNPRQVVASGQASELSGKRPRMVQEEFTEADRRREAEDQRRMRATCQRKLGIKVEEWGRLLDLSEAEIGVLLAAIGPAMEGLDPPVAELAQPRLEETLRSMLEGDGLIAFQQLELRQREALEGAKVEARLAEISAVLLLEPSQQAALRQGLSDEVERLPDPARRVAPGLAPEALAEVTRRLAIANDDGTGFMATAGAVVRERIEADLDGLAEILSPDQLETYRQHLEEVHAQWLLPMP